MSGPHRIFCRVRGVGIAALLWASWACPALAQSFGIGLEAPTSVTAGNTFAARTTLSVSGSSAFNAVIWLEIATALAEDFGQSEALQLQSATQGGTFTATAIVVDGVEVPAGSVYWRTGLINAGVSISLTANLRAPNGSLAGTVHTLQARVQLGPGAPDASSTPRNVTVSATPRPQVALNPGAGWIPFQPAFALAGSTVNFVVIGENLSSIGTETLYEARAWVPLAPLCAALGDSTADCVARVGDITGGGAVLIDFDPDGEGGLPAGPAVLWSLGAIAPGARPSRSFAFNLPEGVPDPTPFTLAAHLDSARSIPVASQRDFTIGLGNAVTPTGTFAMGNRIRGSSGITANNNDNPHLSVRAGEPFTLLALSRNEGISRLGDILMFVRVPESVRFVSAFIPASPGTRVFYSVDESFPDWNQPPPTDIAGAIGNTLIPDDIDVVGNDHWQALDTAPPADPSAVRWVAFYAAELASSFFPGDGLPSSVTAEITVMPIGVSCSSGSISARGLLRVFSTRPPNGSEVAITPPIAVADTESVNLANNTPAIALSASGASSVTAGSATPAQVNFSLTNTGNIPIADTQVTLTWPTLSINGVATRPAFVSATGGAVDASNAANGEVIVSLPPVSPGSSAPISLSLLYPAGVVGGSTHAIRADGLVAGEPCANGIANATRTLVMLGEPQLQVSTSRDQAGVTPGAALSFSGRQRNSGNGVAAGAFVYGPVPPHTVFRRAELPPGRRLLCSAPPLDADLPADLLTPGFVFNAGVFATRFVLGTLTAQGWVCPGGDATSWIALALDDPALTPPSFVVDSDETWRLHLVNDEIRDEPDLQQQGSAVGTEIPFQLAILANGLLPAVSNRVNSVVADESTPLATLALGDNVGGNMQITAGSNDNPSASVPFGGDFELGIRLDNIGLAALGDVVHFLQVPDSLHFQNVTLPAELAGRVFYSTDSGFADPDTPPPVDLSAAIGNADLPLSIDAPGNGHWQALDLDPPTELAAVRWLAVYLVNLPGGAEAAVSRIGLQSVMTGCTESTIALRAPTRVFSTTPSGGSEGPALPAPLALSDAEPVRLANPGSQIGLDSPPPFETIAAGTGVPHVYTWTLRNLGGTALEASTLELFWFPITLNGVSMLPEFVEASGGTIDVSELAFGRIVITPGTIGPGGQATMSLALRYPAGVISPTFTGVVALANAEDGLCGPASEFSFSQVELTGERDLFVSVSADQATLTPGAELSFTGGYGNGGAAVAFGGFVHAPVPAHTSFLRAELPPGRRLACSSSLPEPGAFVGTDYQLGEQTEAGWVCPQGGATNWLLLILFDLEVPFLAAGADETWRLHLRNDEIRDEPDFEQQASPVGTEIALQMRIIAQDDLPVFSNIAVSTVVEGASVTPQAELALGDDTGGTLLITPSFDDNPDATVAPDGGFELGLRLRNPGDVALGDLLQFLRVPAGLRFEAAQLPAALAGRVFYSPSSGFDDPSAPPPVDLSAAIGNASLPGAIDVEGQSHWRALDLDPPADAASVRWLALYLTELPIDAVAISRVQLQVSEPPCATQTVTLPATAQVFSLRPDGEDEIAITPQPLGLSDSEAVHLLGAAPALSLSASGDTTLEITPEGSLLLREFVVGNAGPLTLAQPTLALDWPSLSINGVAVRPEFVAATGGDIDDSNAVDGEIGIALDPLAPGAQATATLSLRYPPGIIAGASHSVAAEAFATGGACDDASASASHLVQLLGSPLLNLSVVADKDTLAPGGDLGFTAEQRNTGTAVAIDAFAWGAVPAETVFRRAELPSNRRLLCSGPPLDALLPADPAAFDASDFADLFVPGNDTGDGWTCPQGDTTSWIALALDDVALTPPSFALGSPEFWTLRLRNDRVRDEPDVIHEPSPDGTLIVFSPFLGAVGLPTIAAEPAQSIVVDILPFTAVCEPPAFTNRDLLDYSIDTSNGVAPIVFKLVAGELPGCVTLDAEGRLRGGSNLAGDWQAIIQVSDASQRQVEASCTFRVLEASVFIDGFELEPATSSPPGGPTCP